MIGKLLYIRKQQILIEVKSLGIFIPFGLGALALINYILLEKFENQQYALYILGGISVFVFYFQLNRSDKKFVHSNIQLAQLEMFLEYFVFTLPFVAAILFTQNRFLFVPFTALLFIISYLKFDIQQKTILKKLSSVLPASNFEWISGIRKTIFIIFPIYLLAVGLSWFKYAPHFLLWFLMTTIVSFFTHSESIEILRANGKPSKQFLIDKIKKNVQLIIILYTPLILINTIVNPENWIVNVLFIPVQLSLLVFAICIKYSMYTPNKKLTANTTLIGIVSIGSIMPFFLPVPVFMILYYYPKAIQNLKLYLND